MNELLTCIWDVEGEEWATRCSNQVNSMLKAHMRFVCMWPTKEQLTPGNHLTTTEVINIPFPNLNKNTQVSNSSLQIARAQEYNYNS